MPQLIPPTGRVHRSFLAAMAEFRAEGRGERQDESMIGTEMRKHGATWESADGFARFVDELHAQGLAETPRPANRVPATTLWWVEADEYLGRVAIRHRLTPFLREVGGHIGYDVRPSARRRGHATAMLAAALPIARDLGIDSALVTCDEDNIASRQVIERNGGVLEDCRGGKLRFWVPTNGSGVNLRIRRAEPSDALAVAEVWLRSYAAALSIVGRAHADDEVRAWIRDVVIPEYETWVAVVGTAVLGMMALRDDWVDQLYLDPRWRGRGIGDRFVELAKRRRPGGLRLWTFQVNGPARRFYERHGFVAVEHTDGAGNEEREPDVRYVWHPRWRHNQDLIA